MNARRVGVLAAWLAMSAGAIAQPAHDTRSTNQPGPRERGPGHPEGNPPGNPQGNPNGQPGDGAPGDRPMRRRPPPGERPMLPPRDGPGQPDGPGGPGGPGDRPWLDNPEAMRGVLNRLRERLQEGLTKVDEGLASLDRGEEPARVRRVLEQAGRKIREAWGGFGGPGGPGGPGAGPGLGQGPGQGPGMGPRPAGPLTEQERDRLRGLIRDHRASLIERLDTLAKRDPKAADRILGAIAGRLGELADARERDPDLFKLKGDELENLMSVMDGAARLSAAKRENKAQEIETIRAELRGYLEQQFDIRVKIQERQLTDLRSRADRMSSDLDGLKRDRAKLVDQKLDEVQRRAERGDGPPPEGPGPGGGPGHGPGDDKPGDGPR